MLTAILRALWDLLRDAGRAVVTFVVDALRAVWSVLGRARGLPRAILKKILGLVFRNGSKRDEAEHGPSEARFARLERMVEEAAFAPPTEAAEPKAADLLADVAAVDSAAATNCTPVPLPACSITAGRPVTGARLSAARTSAASVASADAEPTASALAAQLAQLLGGFGLRRGARRRQVCSDAECRLADPWTGLGTRRKHASPAASEGVQPVGPKG